MSRVYASLPYRYEPLSEPYRLFASQAATVLAMPVNDSLSLLSFGWLASASFGIRIPGNGPNQVSTFNLHLARSESYSLQLAACAQGLTFDNRPFARVDDDRYDLLLVRELDAVQGIADSADVIAVSGTTIVTATVYGAETSRQQQMSTIEILLGSSLL